MLSSKAGCQHQGLWTLTARLPPWGPTGHIPCTFHPTCQNGKIRRNPFWRRTRHAPACHRLQRSRSYVQGGVQYGGRGTTALASASSMQRRWQSATPGASPSESKSPRDGSFGFQRHWGPTRRGLAGVCLHTRPRGQPPTRACTAREMLGKLLGDRGSISRALSTEYEQGLHRITWLRSHMEGRLVALGDILRLRQRALVELLHYQLTRTSRRRSTPGSFHYVKNWTRETLHLLFRATAKSESPTAQRMSSCMAAR